MKHMVFNRLYRSALNLRPPIEPCQDGLLVIPNFIAPGEWNKGTLRLLSRPGKPSKIQKPFGRGKSRLWRHRGRGSGTRSPESLKCLPNRTRYEALKGLEYALIWARIQIDIYGITRPNIPSWNKDPGVCPEHIQDGFGEVSFRDS